MAFANHRIVVKTVVATLCVLTLGVVLIGYVVMMSGIYNVSSTSQHVQVVHSLLEQGMHRSVRFHARNIAAPSLADRQMIERGGKIYQTHCLQCHGAPGIAPSGIGMGMQPVPGPLVDASTKWDAGQLYWIVRYGIKMSGMPAWEYRLPEQELWQVVAFVQQMPNMSPADYAAITRTESKP